jgi:hypothetical protein
MPELVGFAAQGQTVIWGHHLSIGPDSAENDEMRTGALRADLGHFGRAEAARKGELNLVGHLLVTQDQNGMLLEGCARLRIGGIVRGDLGKCQTAQLSGESGTQRHDVHRQGLPVIIAPSLRQNFLAGNDARRAQFHGQQRADWVTIERGIARPGSG